MTRGDKILVAVIVAAAIGSSALLYGRFLLPGSGAGAVQAVVSVQGKVVSNLDLKPGARSTLEIPGRGGIATLELDGRRVRMLRASCENGICLKQGWIEHPGQSIVCVPGEIVVKVEGAAELDAVTR